jgi:hypothetical protein
MRSCGFYLIWASIGAIVLFAGSAAAQDAPPHDIAAVAWLAGDWQTAPAGKMQIDEHWIAPAGGAMLGTSRTVAGGRMVFFEFLRIETRMDGVYYVAQPRGGPPTAFKLTRASASEAVFENPMHDFPKRISYRKNKDGSVTARVEGDGTEKEKPQEFHFHPAAKAGDVK